MYWFLLNFLVDVVCCLHGVTVLLQSQLFEIQISVENSSFTPVSSKIGRCLDPSDRGFIMEGRVYFQCIAHPVELVFSLLNCCKLKEYTGTFLYWGTGFCLLAVPLCVTPSLECVSFYIPFSLLI